MAKSKKVLTLYVDTVTINKVQCVIRFLPENEKPIPGKPHQIQNIFQWISADLSIGKQFEPEQKVTITIE